MPRPRTPTTATLRMLLGSAFLSGAGFSLGLSSARSEPSRAAAASSADADEETRRNSRRSYLRMAILLSEWRKGEQAGIGNSLSNRGGARQTISDYDL